MLRSTHNEFGFVCQAADPVTFTTTDSFLILPKFDAAKQTIISMKIRTNEPSGVLLFR